MGGHTPTPGRGEGHPSQRWVGGMGGHTPTPGRGEGNPSQGWVRDTPTPWLQEKNLHPNFKEQFTQKLLSNNFLPSKTKIRIPVTDGLHDKVFHLVT